MRQWLLVLLIALAGCSSATPRAVYGPYRHETPADLFDRVATILRAQGYEILEENAEYGVLAVATHEMDRCRRRARFVFHFYRGGWIRIDVAGCGVAPHGEGVSMPRALLREYIAVATDLLPEPER